MPKKIGDNKATSLDRITPRVQSSTIFYRGLQALENLDKLAPQSSGLARTRTASLPWDPIGCLAFKTVEPAALCSRDPATPIHGHGKVQSFVVNEANSSRVRQPILVALEVKTTKCSQRCARNPTPIATKQRAESKEKKVGSSYCGCVTLAPAWERGWGVIVAKKPLVPDLVPLGGVRSHGMGETLGAAALKGNCSFFGAAEVWGHSYVSLLVPTPWDSMSFHMLPLRRQVYPGIIEQCHTIIALTTHGASIDNDVFLKFFPTLGFCFSSVSASRDLPHTHSV